MTQILTSGLLIYQPTETDAPTAPINMTSDIAISTNSSGNDSTTKPLNIKDTSTGTMPQASTQKNPNKIDTIPIDYELEYREPCKYNQYLEEFRECNTWNKAVCNSPCTKVKCPKFAKCKDVSNETHPLTECACQLGMEMKDDSMACIAPQHQKPTPR